MKKFTHGFLLFLLLLPIIPLASLKAQDKAAVADSLENRLKSAPIDTNRVDILLRLGRLLHREDPTKARYYGSQVIEISNKLSYKSGLAGAYDLLGLID